MTRINAINPAEATGKAKQLLTAVQNKMGMTPNLMKTLAHSPAALEGYLNFSGALSSGVLDARFREQLALTVAQANSCEYCLSAHSAIGKMVGLTAAELEASRQAKAAGAKVDAGLKFAQTVVVQRGEVSDAAVRTARDAGLSDAELVEIVAHVALNIFTNYFNHVAGTVVDFPRVPAELSQAVQAS